MYSNKIKRHYIKAEMDAPQMLVDLLRPFTPKRITKEEHGTHVTFSFVFDKDGTEVKGTFFDKSLDGYGLHIVAVGNGRVNYCVSFGEQEFKKVKKDVDHVILDCMKGI